MFCRCATHCPSRLDHRPIFVDPAGDSCGASDAYKGTRAMVVEGEGGVFGGGEVEEGVGNRCRPGHARCARGMHAFFLLRAVADWKWHAGG